MKRNLCVILSLAALISCGGVSSSSSSLSSSEKSLSSSSSAATSSSVTSSSTQPLVPGQGAWELTDAALPKNPSQGKLVDVTFSVKNGRGEDVSFFGSDLLHGGGKKDGISIDNTIQVSKETGYFYMTSGYAAYIEFKTLRNIVSYSGEEHDYSGVPSIYTASSMTVDNGTKVELSRETSEDGHYYIYGALLSEGRFRLSNESSNALYIYYLRYPE